MSRLAVQKTLKMYVGGKFIRSESGRTVAAKAADGSTMNVCFASRKDLRDSIGNNRSSQPKWAAMTAYNRGQILYRLAEILEARADTLPAKKADVHAAIDRAVHHAGWSDKVTAVLSTLNPVAATYVNYSLVRPVGVVLAVPHPDDGLLGMVEALCAAVLMGNSTTVLVPPASAEVATHLMEALATSDFPGGVVNILTGDIPGVLATANVHDDLDTLFVTEGVLEPEVLKTAQIEAAAVMRRIVIAGRAAEPATPAHLMRLAELQTVWMSAWEPQGGAAAY
ncbi:MAG: aldehyde dehydrogenase family protein [Myxococcales bacterium]|nr:aldehyde dehydrogenase family protein [Myxococcales bacterium]MCB9671297.1 aldehyde dehydrogenase family protein [Alphaproteobacteria bacterium]